VSGRTSYRSVNQEYAIFKSLFAWALAASVLVATPPEGLAAEPIAAVSPDQRVRIEFTRQKSGDFENVPHFRVAFGGVEVVAPSRLGIEVGGGSALGGSCEIIGVESRPVTDAFTQVSGKRRNVVARASETVIRLRETATPSS